MNGSAFLCSCPYSSLERLISAGGKPLVISPTSRTCSRASPCALLDVFALCSCSSSVFLSRARAWLKILAKPFPEFAGVSCKNLSPGNSYSYSDYFKGKVIRLTLHAILIVIMWRFKVVWKLCLTDDSYDATRELCETDFLDGISDETEVVAMGGCVSSTSKHVIAAGKNRSKKLSPGKKWHRKIVSSIVHVPIRRRSSAGNRVSDVSASGFVHLDLDAGPTDTANKRHDVSNLKFHLTQLQWNHGQIDENGNFDREWRIVSFRFIHYSSSSLIFWTKTQYTFVCR